MTPEGRQILEWNYDLIRLWEYPPETFLKSPGLIPLVALSRVDESDLPDLTRRMFDGVRGMPHHQANEILQISEVLLGLRFGEAIVEALFQGEIMLSESTVYQRILRVGESRGALKQSRESVVEIANLRFGTLPEEFAEQLEKIDDRKRLSRMHKAAVTAATWQDILEIE